MSKVVLTRKQADALEFLKKDGWDNSRIIRGHVRTVYVDGHRWSDNVKALSELSTDELVLAVIIGYEVEQTPEEKLAKAYNEPFEFGSFTSSEYHIKQARYDGRRSGIRYALNTLGITIPGINGNPNE